MQDLQLIDGIDDERSRQSVTIPFIKINNCKKENNL